MASKSFKIGGKTYIGQNASAVEQDEILSLLSAMIMQRVFAMGSEMGTVQKLTIMFMSLPQNIKQRVANLLTQHVSLEDESHPVAVKDFEMKMVEWNTLLAELAYWNFEDFFTYLAAELEKEKLKQSQNTTVAL